MLYSCLYLLGERQASIFNMAGIIKSAHIAASLEYSIIYFIFYALYYGGTKVKSLKRYILIVIGIFILLIIILKLTKRCSDWGDGINGRI